jgi:ribose 5-phosphate isomerase RpiB
MSEVIPIAADHAGFEMKEQLEERLKSRGYEVKDLGVDYVRCFSIVRWLILVRTRR